MEGLENYKLGETDEMLHIETRDDCQQVSQVMANQAQRSLNIFSYDLEPMIYNTPGFYEATRSVIGADSSSLIRILVYDVNSIINKGHRLLDLCSRLSSRVQIRKLTKKYHHAFMIADNIGIVDRRRAMAGDRGDDATPHQIDHDRPAADFDHVSAHRQRNRFSSLASSHNGIHGTIQTIGSEKSGQ